MSYDWSPQYRAYPFGLKIKSIIDLPFVRAYTKIITRECAILNFSIVLEEQELVWIRISFYLSDDLFIDRESL